MKKGSKTTYKCKLCEKHKQRNEFEWLGYKQKLKQINTKYIKMGLCRECNSKSPIKKPKKSTIVKSSRKKVGNIKIIRTGWKKIRAEYKEIYINLLTSKYKEKRNKLERELNKKERDQILFEVSNETKKIGFLINKKIVESRSNKIMNKVENSIKLNKQ